MAKFGEPGAPKRGPGGRPKAVKAVEDIAREHTVLAMNTLSEICGDSGQPASARVSAASTLLDRGWGKARQEHQHRIAIDPSEMTDAELASIAAMAIVPDSEDDSTRH